MGKQFKRVAAHEQTLMQTLHQEGVGVGKIATRLRRSKDTVSKHIFKKHRRGGPPVTGRPKDIDDKCFDKILSKYDTMLSKASLKSGPKEVTVAMLKKAMRLDCTEKTISRAFWKRGVYLRPMYEKPLLITKDIEERRSFHDDHKHRSAEQWPVYTHCVLDCKVFAVNLNARARNYASRRSVRGNYRKKVSKLTGQYVKPKTALKFNTGAKNVYIACAIGAGKVLMWHEVKGRWNGAAAAKMYAGPLKTALQKAWPNVRGPLRVLEDNDPTGYKSSKGMEAKEASGIRTLDLPHRSPDLNPLDFSLWAEVNKRMRKQEKNWPATKTETRDAYVKRLRRTAMNLSPDYINRIIGTMAKRVRLLGAAKGGHFREGGS
jgi:hypothetical protein